MNTYIYIYIYTYIYEKLKSCQIKSIDKMKKTLL